MPIDTRELMEAIAIVADERNVRVAVKQSGKGAAICAACSFAGGMLLGPVGLAVGGARRNRRLQDDKRHIPSAGRSHPKRPDGRTARAAGAARNHGRGRHTSHRRGDAAAADCPERLHSAGCA
uniref:EG:171E4.4 protein n=1 Tax=Drosophila melanogaster TaxID=7227 RepID=O46063_DROME|nr:EG:171E4.4 [Drosophila melanogaster]